MHPFIAIQTFFSSQLIHVRQKKLAKQYKLVKSDGRGSKSQAWETQKTNIVFKSKPLAALRSQGSCTVLENLQKISHFNSHVKNLNEVCIVSFLNGKVVSRVKYVFHSVKMFFHTKNRQFLIFKNVARNV